MKTYKLNEFSGRRRGKGQGYNLGQTVLDKITGHQARIIDFNRGLGVIIQFNHNNKKAPRAFNGIEPLDESVNESQVTRQRLENDIYKIARKDYFTQEDPTHWYMKFTDADLTSRDLSKISRYLSKRDIDFEVVTYHDENKAKRVGYAFPNHIFGQN